MEFESVANNSTSTEINSLALPDKTRERYWQCYHAFMRWKKSENIEKKNFSETVMLDYFTSLQTKYKPSSLWVFYSMLKTTIQQRDNVDIGYPKIISFIKESKSGFVSKKSNTFQPVDISKFLTEAPDFDYLVVKVVLIFGLYGATKGHELTKVSPADVKIQGEVIVVKVPDRKTNGIRSFTIENDYVAYVRKYMNLRPHNAPPNRFFINYRKGRCYAQAIGINKFYAMPKLVANFLNLDDADGYSGYSFKRTSASLMVDANAGMMMLKRQGGWPSSSLGLEDSMVNRTKIEKSYRDDNINVQPSNFDRLCRLCLECVSETSSLCPIFEKETVSHGFGQHSKDFNDNVSEIIATCIGIEIDRSDGLPTGICSKCENLLNIVNTFRHKCLESNDYLQQFKIMRNDDYNDIQDDTSHSFVCDPDLDIAVDKIKIEKPEEITDDESESEISLNEPMWNSNQFQNNNSSYIPPSDLPNNVNGSASKPENESKMCLICGTIVKRLREHISRPQLIKSNRIHHIDIHNNRDSHTLSHAVDENMNDFLMCRMFHEGNRKYVKVEILNSDFASHNHFVRAASNKFNFNIDKFDHFVDEEGFEIDNNDLINVIANYGSQNSFVLGVTLRKDGEISNSSTPSPEKVASQLLTSSNKPITFTDLRNYLIKHDGTHILQEYQEKAMLSEESRTFLVNVALDCLEENFGINPKRLHQEAMAHAIIELFPIYKTKYSSIGGIDLFLNGKTGYLDRGLMHLQSKHRLEEETPEASNAKKPKISPNDDEDVEIVVENNVYIKKENLAAT